MKRAATAASLAFAFAVAIALGTKSTPVASQPWRAMYTVLVPVPQPTSRARPAARALGPSISSLSSGGETPLSQGLKPKRYIARNITLTVAEINVARRARGRPEAV